MTSGRSQAGYRITIRRTGEEGTYVYLWLIHVDVWQKPTQHCKAIILQLKISNFFLKRINREIRIWTKDEVMVLLYQCYIS